MTQVTPYNFSHPFGFFIKHAEDRKIENSINVAGYLPIIGTITGIAKITLGISMLRHSENMITRNIDKEAYRQTAKALILRGCIELTSCGILLLIPDLIVTLKRERSTK